MAVYSIALAGKLEASACVVAASNALSRLKRSQPSGGVTATAHQLLAIFGWETLRQTEVYTRRANRTLLAEQAMHLLVPREKSKSGA